MAGAAGAAAGATGATAMGAGCSLIYMMNIYILL